MFKENLATMDCFPESFDLELCSILTWRSTCLLRQTPAHLKADAVSQTCVTGIGACQTTGLGLQGLSVGKNCRCDVCIPYSSVRIQGTGPDTSL